MRKRNLILLFSLCALFSFSVFIPRVQGFIIYREELSATHRFNEVGPWVEVILHVSVIYYHTGAISFTYGMSHARGLPWTWIWIWGAGEGAFLYERNGHWTAENQRYAWMWAFPLFLIGEYTVVQFRESEMQFYYADAIWGSGEAIIGFVFKCLEPDWP